MQHPAVEARQLLLGIFDARSTGICRLPNAFGGGVTNGEFRGCCVGVDGGRYLSYLQGGCSDKNFGVPLERDLVWYNRKGIKDAEDDCLLTTAAGSGGRAARGSFIAAFAPSGGMLWFYWCSDKNFV